ncbi:hypothetical protein [Spirosoma utsteinense]|uniref:Transposase-like protein n=1 Tax=Spirosoma utsteinense TaxID=2585773 RepID=A0ABR6WEY0_9BACT|nr:hypothetical protein [Spirosoma utsteinense]MBC3788818.1 transposase-like protein [Spirosoma utsteinense]MBC3794854.1 transposase-like protein [Spirosoma utsteinense]
MSKIRRSFTPEDRYSIVQEAIRDGHAETSRKYSLSPSLLRSTERVLLPTSIR